MPGKHITAPPEPNQPTLPALLARFKAKPPDAGLWRELLDACLGDAETFTDRYGQTVSAAAVHHVGWCVYGRADAAGTVDRFSGKRMAADCRLSHSATRSALDVLVTRFALKRTRPSRRAPDVYRLNIGGLSLPDAKRQAAAMFDQPALPEQATKPVDLPLADTGTDGASTPLGGTLSTPPSGTPKRYVQSTEKKRSVQVQAAVADRSEATAPTDHQDRPMMCRGCNRTRPARDVSRQHCDRCEHSTDDERRIVRDKVRAAIASKRREAGYGA